MDLRRDRGNTILEEIQREISGRRGWSRIEVLTRCLPVFADLEGICLKIEPLLDVSIITTLLGQLES